VWQENRPRDVEKSVVEKKKTKKHGQNITVFAYRYSDSRAILIKHSSELPANVVFVEDQFEVFGGGRCHCRAANETER